ncbi:MAG: helix-turn-helix transcriptional regulator [Chloroflexi bacterium]|nr:helix-turn-helix transcriptional regulator [Chloroflexota bacterium]
MLTESDRLSRRAQRRRQAILEAAARVFSRKGFDRATTREIAQEADIAEGTIYKYFGSKRDLLLNIVEQVAPNLFQETLPLEGLEANRETFVENFEHMLTYVSENRELLAILAGEMWRDREIFEEWVVVGGQDLVERVTNKIKALAKTGALRDDVDLSLAARLILSASLGLVLAILLGTLELPTQSERRRLAEGMVDLLLYGLWRRDGSMPRGGAEG